MGLGSQVTLAIVLKVILLNCEHLEKDLEKDLVNYQSILRIIMQIQKVLSPIVYRKRGIH